MTIHDLDTPALLIDANVLDCNLRKMAQSCKDHRLALRPHTKTHKIPEIARLQLRHGAAGITVAKLGEAEVMADAGMEVALNRIRYGTHECQESLTAISSSSGKEAPPTLRPRRILR